MFTMITTEEYRNLIEELAETKSMLENISFEFKFCDEKRDKAEESLKELLLMLTKGEIVAKWDDKKFESFDIEREGEIAKFINANYVENGVLTFTKKEKKDAE